MEAMKNAVKPFAEHLQAVSKVLKDEVRIPVLACQHRWDMGIIYSYIIHYRRHVYLIREVR